MKLIAAVDKNWAIGNNGDLLYHFPEDMRFFKKITMESEIVIMGRKTFESLPNVLSDRINIVLTRDPETYKPEVGESVYNLFTKKYNSTHCFVMSFSEFMNYCESGLIDKDKACVIGGGEIYKLFLPFINEAYITKIDSCKSEVDTYFPINLDDDPNWKLVDTMIGKDCERVGTLYSFNKYKRK